MWLDDFVDLIALLKERADKIETEYVGTEALTRSSLIDPMLEHLGWDIHDPTHVIPEFSTSTGRADYALFGKDSNKPRVFLEAKKLKRSLADGLEQSIAYCVGEGVDYFVVTDGIKWSAYEAFRRVKTADKQLFSIDLKTGSSHQHIMELIWLWRGNFADDAEPTSPVSFANLASTEDTEDPLSPRTTETQSVVDASSSRMMIEDLHAFLLKAEPGHKVPSLMSFPDGTEASLHTWRDVQNSTVHWLVGIGKLSAADCPVLTPQGSHIVHTSPVKSTGKDFESPHQVDGLWVDHNRSAKYQVLTAIQILDQFGTDLSKVLLG